MLFRIVFVILLLPFLSGESYAGWCHHDSGCGGSCTSDYLMGSSALTSVADPVGSTGAYACKNKYTLKIGTTTTTMNARIGWGDTCATPSGDNAPNQATCLTTHNLLGKIIDTFLTVGIAPTMFNQYCSFSAGDPALEGAIIDQKLLTQCKDITPLQRRKKCVSCLFKGLGYTTDPDSNDCVSTPISINNYMRADSNICEGIPNFDKPVIGSDNKIVNYNGDVVYCPLMRCNIPTNDILSKYHDSKSNRMEIIGALAAAATAETGGLGFGVGLALIIAAAATPDCCDLKAMTSGDTEHVGFWGAVNLRGTTDGDRICTQMLMPLGYTTVGCKFRTPPPVVYPKQTCGLKNTACTYGSKGHGKWVMPLTSTLMECVHDVIQIFFQPTQGTNIDCPTSQLFEFQNSLRNIVRILFILYVILYGMNLAFSSSPIKKGEIFSFIFKFALVAYFSVGTFSVTTSGNFDTAGAQSYSKNGLELLKDVAFDGMNSFASMIMNATGGSTNGISSRPCIFNYDQYDDGYGYLALWDAIDCHLSFYLGLAAPTALGLENVTHGTDKVLTIDAAGGLLSLIFPALLSIELVLIVFIIAFTIFLFSIVVYFTNLYIVAMLAVTVLIFFGPFFVPMVLFKYTRRMFDAWVNLLFGYALQPVVVTAFIALFVTTFHYIFYNGCQFVYQEAAGLPFWIFDSSVVTEGSLCESSFGYIMSQLNPNVALQRASFGEGMFYYNTLISNWKTTMDTMLDGLMLSTFFAFLFYYFAEQLSAFAADLSGSLTLGGVVSPNAVTNLALKKLTQGKMSAAKQAAQGGGDKGIKVSGAGGSGVQVAGRAGIQVSAKSSSSGSSSGSGGGTTK